MQLINAPNLPASGSTNAFSHQALTTEPAKKKITQVLLYTPPPLE